MTRADAEVNARSSRARAGRDEFFMGGVRTKSHAELKQLFVGFHSHVGRLCKRPPVEMFLHE